MTPPADSTTHDRRRPTNGEIVERLEIVEMKIDKVLSAFEIDDAADPVAWRKLWREHNIVRAQRSFCEQVGWKFIWIVVTLFTLIGITHLDELKSLAGIK